MGQRDVGTGVDAAPRVFGIALDLHDLLVLDVDFLAAAHGAVRAYGFDDAVGSLRTRFQLRRLHG